MIDHDRLFKELISTFFVEFLDLFLPQVASQIDRDSIQFLPQDVFTDVTSGENKLIYWRRCVISNKKLIF
ncbi:hypothetical protein [uncultured Nostoc sp.]|uniref:hypothetical protein n=1 Tax=uncultured Nostoc sp. TaxID=340711 RepID=UPI0026369D5D|nr:hypothetical protein [uncultured Nostoc sp.]